MKRYFFVIFTIFLFVIMLLFPGDVFQGARNGLLLWFETVLPTLLPFLIIVNIMLRTSLIRHISRLVYPVLGPLFSVSPGGCFAVLTGFLCGYPMGAKVTADLLRAGRISQDEARYLLSFCNNTSPVFIINFIVWKTFGNESLMLPGLSILIGTPVLLSFAFRKYYLKGRRAFPDPSPALKEKKTCFNFSVLDSCMMNSFEAIVKVGGYIILFSVLLSLLRELAGQSPAVMAAAPVLEVTNGILLIRSTVSDPGLCFAAVLGLTSFGGLCSIAQTQCMLEGTGLSVIPYTIQKLTAAAAASLLAILYLTLFSPFH